MCDKALCIRSFGGAGYNYEGYTEEEINANPGSMNPVRVRKGSQQYRGLDIDEKALCLGLPPSYMKNGQGSHSKRHEILGQTFSVPVIKHLLEPLRECFSKVKPSCTS